MKFSQYLYAKTLYIITNIIIFILAITFLFLTSYPVNNIILLLIGLITISTIYLLVDFYNQKNKYYQLYKRLDTLKEKYLLIEILPPPSNYNDEVYQDILRKSLKSMNDNIIRFQENFYNYRDYVELWAHEIKGTVLAISLTIESYKNEDLLYLIGQLNNFIEQILFYARSNNVERDLFINKLSLEEIIHEVILNNKIFIMKKELFVDVCQDKIYCYSDKKWLIFIVDQVINNSIKYSKNQQKLEVNFSSAEDKVILSIKDYGCGISKSDLPRVFEKGFSGNNRNKTKSTGIGLYLVKKLSQALNIEVTIDSIENKYTEVVLTIPAKKFI